MKSMVEDWAKLHRFGQNKEKFIPKMIRQPLLYVAGQETRIYKIIDFPIT